MGISGNLFTPRTRPTEAVATDDATDTCDTCGEEYPLDELDESGLCEDCANDDGTRYCCGMMYTDGESWCSSCGEWLSPKD